MNWKDYISSDPKILFGKPAIRGTRIAVDLILEKLSYGESIEQIMDSYPHLKKESIFACLSFAAENLRDEIIYPLAS
jgi:uncharacterized protein (DUF433 family)